MPVHMLWYDDYSADDMGSILLIYWLNLYFVAISLWYYLIIVFILIAFVDLIRKCPYNIWEDSDISCKMFPDSTDSEVCTTIGDPPDEGRKHT